MKCVQTLTAFVQLLKTTPVASLLPHKLDAAALRRPPGRRFGACVQRGPRTAPPLRIDRRAVVADPGGTGILADHDRSETGVPEPTGPLAVPLLWQAARNAAAGGRAPCAALARRPQPGDLSSVPPHLVCVESLLRPCAYIHRRSAKMQASRCACVPRSAAAQARALGPA